MGAELWEGGELALASKREWWGCSWALWMWGLYRLELSWLPGWGAGISLKMSKLPVEYRIRIINSCQLTVVRLTDPVCDFDSCGF